MFYFFLVGFEVLVFRFCVYLVRLVFVFGGKFSFIFRRFRLAVFVGLYGELGICNRRGRFGRVGLCYIFFLCFWNSWLDEGVSYFFFYFMKVLGEGSWGV